MDIEAVGTDESAPCPEIDHALLATEAGQAIITEDGDYLIVETLVAAACAGSDEGIGNTRAISPVIHAEASECDETSGVPVALSPRIRPASMHSDDAAGDDWYYVPALVWDQTTSDEAIPEPDAVQIVGAWGVGCDEACGSVVVTADRVIQVPYVNSDDDGYTALAAVYTFRTHGVESDERVGDFESRKVNRAYPTAVGSDAVVGVAKIRVFVLAVGAGSDEIVGDPRLIADAPSGAGINTVYRCVLTGAPNGAPDLDLSNRMISFQTTKRNTGKIHLAVCIVGVADIIADIAARANGEIVLEKGAASAASVSPPFYFELARVAFDAFEINDGLSLSTATISGTGAVTYTPRSGVQISDVTSKTVINGKRTYQCSEVIHHIVPGDTVVYEGVGVVVGEVTIAVAVANSTMELVEAA
ncbi:MAG: hypothetical protein HQL74_07265 [Magnetococcales bacterium]|nr:hypothetical protein [Magnetococcales bacterium]